jgi:hypothetical protein
VSKPKSIEFRPASEVFAEWLETHDLKEFFTRWDVVTAGDVLSLRMAIDDAVREEDVQRYLRDRPFLLIEHLGGGHGRWVIPKLRLGSEHVTDFMIGDEDSSGRRWIAVELENPRQSMFTKAGDPSQSLNHALRQIMDWRVWLTNNRAYAIAPRSEKGLGLEDIDPQLPGLVLIGRRGLGPNPRGLRRQLENAHNVQIHSYDWLIERTHQQVEAKRAR